MSSPEIIVQTTHNALQIATKIHFFLLREMGQGIDVEQMLNQPRYARDVLLVCDACRGTELARLAEQYRAAIAELQSHARTGKPGHTQHALDWGRDTSGFGLSRPMTPVDAPATGLRAWISRAR
jgi:hypothetical protein